MRVKISAQAGFSFPELLVSAGVLAFCISALIGFFVNSIALNQAARNTTTALSHAQAVLENVRDVSVVATVKTNITNGVWTWNADTQFTSQGLSRLKNETITTTFTSLSGNSLITVTVTAAWNDNIGRARSLALTAMMGGA